jgi:hypothetical protein
MHFTEFQDEFAPFSAWNGAADYGRVCHNRHLILLYMISPKKASGGRFIVILHKTDRESPKAIAIAFGDLSVLSVLILFTGTGINFQGMTGGAKPLQTTPTKFP